jgi:DNA-binding transcriptional MerR regulator
MKPQNHNEMTSLPLYEISFDLTFSLEHLSKHSGVDAETILNYFEKGLLASVSKEPLLFTEGALFQLSRVEHFRTQYRLNLEALKLVMDLMDEVEKLRAESRLRIG